MLKFFKDIFLPENDENTKGNYQSEEKKIQIATCALFLEVANSDDELSKVEKKEIFKIMKELFDLEDECVSELINLSNEQIENSVSLYEFTDVINQSFDENHKYEIIKNLWRLIYSDEELSPYEESFIKKITGNFHLTHYDLINAKLEVKEELGLK